MDERIGFSIEDDERNSSSQWHFTHSNSMECLESEPSKEFLQYENYHLHLIQKREQKSSRLMVPCSKHAMYSYFRSYFASQTQLACMHAMSFNRLFWLHISNTILKSYSHHYVHLFFASYTPEEHFFISKIIPFMSGTTFFNILASCLGLVNSTLFVIYFLNYLVGGIFLKNPWNRCPEGGIQTQNYINVSCYNLQDFGKRVENTTVIYDQSYYYIVEKNEWLQLVQIEFFVYMQEWLESYVILNAFLVWVIVSVYFKQIFKKRFWKVLNIVHWSTVILDVISFIFLVVDDFLAEYPEPTKIEYKTNTIADVFEIYPERDSTILVLSNGIYIVFNALLSYRVKRRCESIARVPIFLADESNARFYIWPMYYSTFLLGDLYTLIYLLLHFLMEIITLIVTFQSLVEVVECEYPILPKWLTFGIFMCIETCLTSIHRYIYLTMIYVKCFAILIECVVLYWMYPIGRLIDDITFHYGSQPNRIRIQLLYIVPFYYLWKLYKFLNLTIQLLLDLGVRDLLYLSLGSVAACMITSLGAGMVYTFYYYVWKQKKHWTSLFIPYDDWGPRDNKLRQLRKQYDSRTFYNSNEPRDLARHMISKADFKAYELDIRYEAPRLSTASGYR